MMNKTIEQMSEFDIDYSKVEESIADLITKTKQTSDEFLARNPNFYAKRKMMQTMCQTLKHMDPIFDVLNTMVQCFVNEEEKDVAGFKQRVQEHLDALKKFLERKLKAESENSPQNQKETVLIKIDELK